MSDTQSNLAPTGFDYVVGVTQDGINASLETPAGQTQHGIRRNRMRAADSGLT
jgi:hypothetical protein